MWFVTAWRHRYFAHRSFKINPIFSWIEPIIAFVCSADAQRGVGQWAAEHIYHHKYSDKPEDHHSCKQNGTQWCHWLWVVKKGEDRYVDWRLIPHLSSSKSIRWIEERQWMGIVLFGGVFSFIGAILSIGGFQSFIANFTFSLCAYFFSTFLLWHGTFLINSAMHIIGTQKFDTGDESKNSLICAILTMGEGWHNNHHWDFPTLEKAKELKGRVNRNSKELYWQGKTFFERCFDWSGISIWILIKMGILRTN
jgi:stearoyl-CoA desaturase (delta-9 desaturase)